MGKRPFGRFCYFVPMWDETYLHELIQKGLSEDVGEGDHTTLALIPETARAKMECWFKDEGIVAGIQIAKAVFTFLNNRVQFDERYRDGDFVHGPQLLFTVEGPLRSLLIGERLALNLLQRLSGIASTTYEMVQQIRHTKAKLLDTRKTTPLLRQLEKWAFQLGGGVNHRFGLYDAILIKDNHIDYVGDVYRATLLADHYRKQHQLSLPLIVEIRSLEELRNIDFFVQHADRLLLDNFTVKALAEAVQWVQGKIPLEASGGVTQENVKAIAETGVDFISTGYPMHSYRSKDISLKLVTHS
jgi:nicotinate-nucleotide pyrophosphorylase (carboxylating)